MGGVRVVHGGQPDGSGRCKDVRQSPKTLRVEQGVLR
jgi:hypothetical protein